MLFPLIFVLSATTLLGGGLMVSPASAGGCVEPVTDEEGVRVDLTGVCFRPTVLRIDAGQRVEWTNDDALDHTVTGANLAWGSIDNLHPKESFAYTFKEPGVYPYSCILHYGMVGAVVVRDEAAPKAGTAVVGAEPPQAPPASGSSLTTWLLIVAGATAIATTAVVLATRRRATEV
jgi:plastocyanin